MPTASAGVSLASDGEPLRYAIHGAGHPGTPVQLHNGLVSSIVHWPFFLAHYAPRRPVITWDYRGHGGAPAPRDPASVTVECFADDAHVVATSATSGKKIVAGLSFGVQVALEQFRRHPEDVAALVLICGTFGHPLDRVSTAAAVRGALARMMRGFGRTGSFARALLERASRSSLPRELTYLTGGAHREHCPPEILDGLFAHVAAMDPRVIGAVVASYLEHTAREVLPLVSVPTLILAGEADQLTPVSLAELMARTIPGARLVTFPGHSHLVQVELPDQVHAAIDDFLVEHHL
jgi:pimeloyl-ACP methyl ester carboxylesterase